MRPVRPIRGEGPRPPRLEETAETRTAVPAGHAIHFLTRLGRASGAAAELALSLYQDPQMMRFVLGGVRIPGEYDRVAVSLEEGDKGPYVVATRNGRFVTCLGPGMGIDTLHLIPHAQLLAHMQKSEVYRERMALANSIVGKGRETEKLLHRVMTKSDDLTKEEMLALSATQTALKEPLLVGLLDSTLVVSRLGQRLRKKKSMGKKEKKLLRKYWDMFWASGHLALLSSMNGIRGVERVIDEAPGGFLRMLSLLLCSGTVVMSARLVWFIGKMGPRCLPECKRLMHAAETPETWLMGMLGAAAIALRHGRTRFEVLKALEKSFKSVPDYPRDVQRQILFSGAEPVSFIENVFAAVLYPDETHARYLQVCKDGWVDAFEDALLPEKYRWRTADQVPDDMALTYGSCATRSFHTSPTWSLYLVLMLPWIARCEAEDFYFPHDFYKHIQIPWQVSHAKALIDFEREVCGAEEPIRAKETPGRNDPCTCGSGLKYKRCCI